MSDKNTMREVKFEETSPAEMDRLVREGAKQLNDALFGIIWPKVEADLIAAGKLPPRD